MPFALLSIADPREFPFREGLPGLLGADQSSPFFFVQSWLERFETAAFLSGIDDRVATVVTVLEHTLFFSIHGLPLVVVWLMGGAIFFTLRMAFINVRAFPHAIAVVMGRYDNPDEPGEVTHFQALATALSATVGLGNIAGVAIAIQLGGPGALMWMTVAGLLGMTSKFVECTLGQKYRIVRPDGTISGGPMYYLSRGLAEMGLKPLGQLLAVAFSLICIVASFGGGNMFQANQSYAALASLIPFFADHRWVYGLAIAGLVGLVIIGGIRRIGAVAGAITPLMAGIYLMGALWVLWVYANEIPHAISVIIHQALSPEAVEGGFFGVMAQGIRRGVFSNEAGVGSAAIAHSAARTDEPVREGIVALLEPFIDTVVICNITGLVCIVTGAYRGASSGVIDGVSLTASAFASVLDWFPILLSVAVCLFAFSTMISWSYYGERCWNYLFGDHTVLLYKLTFIVCVFLGTVMDLGAVLTFSDMMLFVMSFPSMLGALLLSGQVADNLEDYWRRLNADQMAVYR